MWVYGDINNQILFAITYFFLFLKTTCKRQILLPSILNNCDEVIV